MSIRLWIQIEITMNQKKKTIPQMMSQNPRVAVPTWLQAANTNGTTARIARGMVRWPSAARMEARLINPSVEIVRARSSGVVAGMPTS